MGTPPENGTIRRRLARFLLVGVAYAVGSELAFSWFGADGFGASFFPAAGVTIAAMVLWPRREWPVVLVAAATAELLLDLAHGIALVPSLGYVAANTLQPLVGASIMVAFAASDLSRRRDLVVFVTGGVMVAAFVGAVIGATTFVLLKHETGWWTFASEWWIGDGLGILVVGGTILSLHSAPVTVGSIPRDVEVLVIAALAALATGLAFRFEHFGFVYPAMALVFVAAFRTGTRGVAVAGGAMAFVAAQATAAGRTLWSTAAIPGSTGRVYIQLTLAIVIVVGLVLASEIKEREMTVLAYANAEAGRRKWQAEATRARQLRELQAALDGASEYELSGVLAAHGFDDSGNSLEADSLLSAAGREMVRLHFERAALWHEELRSRELRERLQEVKGALASARSVDGVTAIVGGDLAEALGGSRGDVYVLTGDRVELGPGPLGDTLRSRNPVLIPSRNERATWYPALPDADDGPSAWAYVPLIAGLRVVGAMTVEYAQPQRFDADQRVVLVTTAHSVAQAIQRATLTEAEREASERAEFLATYSAELEHFTSVGGRAFRAVELLAERGAGAAIHVEVDDALTCIACEAMDDVPQEVLDDLARGALDAAAPLPPKLCVLSNLHVAVTRLEARNRVIGTLITRWRGVPDSDELREIGLRTALVLENALLYERERDTSHTLQQALLGSASLAFDGLDAAAIYRPGSASLQVGGDWYDAFELSKQRIALVVGDAVGHDLDAAIAMGQLRGAVRALAPLSTPSQLLTRLDEFVANLPAARLATLAYVDLDLSTGVMKYACAGHLPPLLRTCETVDYLWEGRSTPLGLRPKNARSEGTAHAPSGSTLLLYTDGLVERRTVDLDTGLQRLLDVVRECGSAAPQLLASRVVDSMTGTDHLVDDVCMLAVRSAAVEQP